MGYVANLCATTGHYTFIDLFEFLQSSMAYFFSLLYQGEEIGPLELQIHTLQKQIEARLNEITELQQFWLRNQSELVKTLKDVQKQSEDMEYLKKQYTILLQKKLRIEGMAGV